VLGFSALQGGFAWASAGITSMAFAGVSQLLVTKGSAKLVMAFGMTAIGVGILWTTQAPVHGQFWGNLFGPFVVAVGLGSAFAFIPISIAGLAGVAEDEAGLASSPYLDGQRGSTGNPPTKEFVNDAHDTALLADPTKTMPIT